MRRTLTLSLLIAAGCAGSPPPDTTDTGGPYTSDEMPSCDEVETVISDLTAVIPELGVAPQELLDGVVGDFPGTLTLEAGGAQEMALSLVLSGDVIWVDREVAEYTGTGTYPAIGVVCEDSLVLPLSATFSSAPALDEVAELRLAFPTAEEGVASVRWALDELVGTAAPTFDPATKDRTTFDADVSFGGGEWVVDFMFGAEESGGGTGGDGWVSWETEPWGTFSTGDLEQ